MAAGVGVRSDLPPASGSAHGAHIAGGMQTAIARVPTAKYTKMGETLRHVIPGHMQCSMACGGRACKYENPSRWSDEEQAIKGLYSSWITDNLLAMARPSTEIMDKYNIIQQFESCGLKTVINLQRPGEHASCGYPLEPESGFTYRPETFMEAGIYYYNFGWKDYGVASLTTILDMVKVMSFAVQEGKMAVHCHAGLGRTGVLLACYLVFTSRMTADQAILFVRAKRPNSIQTRGQLLCVREFAQFLVPLRSVFSCAEPRAGAVTLSQYLTRQRHLLHGYEARLMKNVPKIVRLACRLLADVAADRQVVVEEEWAELPDLTAEVEKTVSQQALQQLGKEMRGKGIPVPPCPAPSLCPDALQPRPPHDQALASDSDLDPLWRLQNAASPGASSLLHSRRLSYSDSVLHRLEQQGQPPLSSLLQHSLSHSSLPPACPPPPQDAGSKVTHRSVSPCSSTVPVLPPRSRLPLGHEDRPRAPFISLQSELAPEARRLMVAKALALDLMDQDLSTKVSAWQTELNSREGAWERLCVERDPRVLSGLMWSWLEQLKEPIISSEDVRSLSQRSADPHSALHALHKDHRLTLLCVLDCGAQLLPLPPDVESSFLQQTVRAFTKTEPAAQPSLFQTLTQILTPVLHSRRDEPPEPPLGINSAECRL
ncbi:protein tyrosine phosphatase domain-containing protein 1 [Salarias fasciatus]|uniref:Protein tyrosine phosphatase domain-containing protein 1 n=1 Tax=Salarias fasciatus TaxID=181472 RepID=A0A672HP26_SALFA|nr:protein tyrosine phosphatase domain-containing protein 1 [Salarias fasciatus]